MQMMQTPTKTDDGMNVNMQTIKKKSRDVYLTTPLMFYQYLQ